MKLLTVVGWTARGPVRGACGHRHSTPERAEKCAAADEKRCARHGALADRRVLPVLTGDTVQINGEESWITGDVQAYAVSIAEERIRIPLRATVVWRDGQWWTGPAAVPRARVPKNQTALDLEETP